MEFVVEISKIVLPAGLVLLAMYLSLKSFFEREQEKNLMDFRSKIANQVLPVKLQAYERIILYLERITPSNIMLRTNDSSYNALEFQQILLSEIRNEYNHNISMQIYVSNEAWAIVKNAMEQTISLVNQSANGLTFENSSLDLAKRIIENMTRSQEEPTQKALDFVKQEFRQYF
jgi:hypothetical protein